MRRCVPGEGSIIPGREYSPIIKLSARHKLIAYKKIEVPFLLCGDHDLVEDRYVEKEVDAIHTALSLLHESADCRLTHTFVHAVADGN